MSYEDDVRRVADHLARLLTAPSGVTADELALVDGARKAVRQLCEQVLDALEPDNPHQDSPLTRLTEPALLTFRHLLEREPTPLATEMAAATDWTLEPQTENGRRWRELHRAALVAGHEWAMIYPQARPTGRDAWPIVTDMAALAEALALLELDVDPGDGVPPGQLQGDDSWNLAFVAEHVRRLSPREASRLSAPLPSRRRHTLLRVRSIADTPAAASRLVSLIRTAHRLRPETVRTLARGHAELLLRLAKAFELDSPPDAPAADLIDGLRTQSASLENLAAEAQKYRTLEGDDPRPTQQLHLLKDQWRKPASDSGDVRTATLRFLAPALAVVTALGDAIERQVDNGHWYIRVKGGLYRWQRMNAATRPPIFDVARDAVAQAERLRRLVPSRPPDLSAGAPRDVLVRHLNARHQHDGQDL